MRMWFIAVLALAACHKKPSLEELTKMKDEACACKDEACAQKVDKQIESALGDISDEKDLDDKAQAVVLDIAMCLARQGVH